MTSNANNKEHSGIRVGVHHWQGSFRSHKMRRLMDAVEAFVGEHFFELIDWQELGGLNGYQCSFRWEEFIVFCFDRDREFNERIHNGKASVIFRGSFFDRLPLQALPVFAEVVKNATCTRWDVYLQDLERRAEIFEIFGQFKKGQCRGFRSHHYHDSGANGLRNGESLELGRRGKSGSGKFMRIYDKDLESKYEDRGIRFEVEWSGERAVTAWDLLVKANFEPEAMGGQVIAAAQWVEKTDDHHRDRWQYVPWYQSLIDGLPLVFVKVEKKGTNIEKKVGWVQKSVAGSLAYIQAFMHYIDGTDEGFEGFVGMCALTGRKSITKALALQLQRDVKEYAERRELSIAEPTVKEIRSFLKGAA